MKICVNGLCFLQKLKLHFHLNLYMQALVYDFQPKDPENIYAALAVLSNKAIPGDFTPLCLSYFKGCSISK